MPVTIAEMTLDDLRSFIEETLDQRLGVLDETDHLSWDEVRALADQYRWTPPTGATPSLVFLREDRDK